MLADTFLKRTLSQLAFREEKSEITRKKNKNHTLVLVKSESSKGEKLIKYALNQNRNGNITILCVLKLSLSSEILNGRVLEPMGEEDMVLLASNCRL
jgi:type II secretory pathway component PulJ